MSTDLVERLRQMADHDANDYAIGHYWNAVDEAADEIERLREHIKAIEKWHEQGKKLFDNYSVGLGAMFGLGKWWGERPWGAKDIPYCASCGKQKERCDGC